MPDTRQHRGPHPEDQRLFAPESWPALREAVGDLSWLLTRGYSDVAACKLVGDRLRLTERQRTAVMRSSCSDQALRERSRKEVAGKQLANQPLVLDGFNVLTTIEAALSGGVLLACRDGCYRDLASMHGSYRKVQETRPALELVGRVLESLQPSEARWYLDRPVSNSGRLAAVIREFSTANRWCWSVELVDNPDAVLVESAEIVASADSIILDRCTRWFNLAREIVQQQIPAAVVIDLS